MQGNVRLPLPLSNPPHGIGTEQLDYLSPEDALVQWKGEESSGKVSIGGHGDEKVRIVVSESSEGWQHSENFMGCTVQRPQISYYSTLSYSRSTGLFFTRYIPLPFPIISFLFTAIYIYLMSSESYL